MVTPDRLPILFDAGRGASQLGNDTNGDIFQKKRDLRALIHAPCEETLVGRDTQRLIADRSVGRSAPAF